MYFISLNDEIIDAKNLNFYQVERFRVADACFESVLYTNGRFPLLSYHQERLDIACKLLAYDSYSISISSIMVLLEKNKLSGNNARIRISLVRKEGCNYMPKGNSVNVLIEVIELESIFKPLNQIGLFENYHKPMNSLSKIKSANALIYVMALNYAQDNHYDDVLIKNELDHWIEASSSNLFFIKNNELFTSKDNSGCVLGVARNFLINFLELKKVDITEQCLINADEIFLSNAIQLIQPVLKFKNRKLKIEKTQELIELTGNKLGI